MATFTQHKDQLVVCPYDKTHKIALRHQIQHIIECEKKIGSKLSVCIYNASHRMARYEFAKHLQSCPDGRHQIRALQSSASQETEIKANDKVEDQTTIEAVPSCSAVDTDSDDEWANDNSPHFSIYGNFQTHNEDVVSEEKPKQKLTKNQKKRNRRKATKEANIKSIWD